MKQHQALPKGLRRQLARRQELAAAAPRPAPVAPEPAPASVAIRPATREDYAGIARVIRRTIPATYGRLLLPAQVRRVEVVDDAAGHEAALAAYGAGYLVAAGDDGAIVGYAVAGRGRLEHAYVLPADQGRGVGSALLVRCLGHLRAAGDRHAETPALWTNLRARRFLERRGAVLVGARRRGGTREARYRVDLGER